MSSLGDSLYEMVPGFLCGTLAMVAVSLLTKPPAQEILDEFDRAAHMARTDELVA